jgi:hypothetical protein
MVHYPTAIVHYAMLNKQPPYPAAFDISMKSEILRFIAYLFRGARCSVLDIRAPLTTLVSWSGIETGWGIALLRCCL